MHSNVHHFTDYRSTIISCCIKQMLVQCMKKNVRPTSNLTPFGPRTQNYENLRTEDHMLNKI